MGPGVGNGRVKRHDQVKAPVCIGRKIFKGSLDEGDAVEDTGLFRQLPGFVDHGLGNIEVCDLQPLPGEQDGKAAAAGSAVKDGLNAIQVAEQFPLDMRLLYNIVDKGLLPLRLQFSLIREVPHPICNPGTVIHMIILLPACVYYKLKRHK